MKHKDSKKNMIEEKSIMLFYDMGYKDCTLRKMASECGVTHSTILKHFKSKSELAFIVDKSYIDDLIRMTELFRKDHEIFIDERTDIVLYYWCLHYYFMRHYPKLAKFYIEYYECDSSAFAQSHLIISEKLFRDLFKADYNESESVKDLLMHALTAVDIRLTFFINSGTAPYEEVCCLFVNFVNRAYNFIGKVSESQVKGFIGKFISGDRLKAYDLFIDKLSE